MVKHGKNTHSKEAEINNPVTKDVLTSWCIPPFKNHVSSKPTFPDTGIRFSTTKWPPASSFPPSVRQVLPGLVNIRKTIENGPVEIVDSPINSMVIFHSSVNVYQRVNCFTKTCYLVAEKCISVHKKALEFCLRT